MNTILLIIFVCMIIFPIGVYIIQKRNLNYYKLIGREPIEIECWLKTRNWYKEFIDNIELDAWNNIKESFQDEDTEKRIEYIKAHENEVSSIVNSFVSGEEDKNTISNAFYWAGTKQGSEYWGKREYEFLKWYFGQYIDLHLLK